MLYLSKILGTRVYYQGKLLGTVSDVAVLENYLLRPVSRIIVKKGKRTISLSSSVIDFGHKPFVAREMRIPLLEDGSHEFYLKETLLDKQVVDIDGKRVVRVNDVALENGNELHLAGIDIGVAGLFRRLGPQVLLDVLHIKPKLLPWQLIEAFDYQNGAIKIKLKHNRLNFLHHSELADILQEVGAKERIGILESLSPQKAALALQEANTKTQGIILEQLSAASLETIVSKMHVSRLADILYKLNTFRMKEILEVLGSEKAQMIKKLSSFGPDTAGGLMHVRYYRADGEKTIQEVIDDLEKQEHPHPEAIVVTDANKKFLGIVHVKHLFQLSRSLRLKEAVEDREFVHPEIRLPQLIRLFSQYDLRILPVVDYNQEILGVVTIDRLLHDIENETIGHAF